MCSDWSRVLGAVPIVAFERRNEDIVGILPCEEGH